jgi:hypothetical protein
MKKQSLPIVPVESNEFLNFAKKMNKNAELDIVSGKKSGGGFLTPLTMNLGGGTNNGQK